MKEKEKEKEIDADKASLLVRDYFEKDKAGKEGDAGAERATSKVIADWRNLTIDSIKRGRKDFQVKCELYEEPSSATKTKYRIKITKSGEIKQVSKEA